MRAIIAKEAGSADHLELIDRDIPQVGPGQLLVEVDAAGVNRLDINQRKQGTGHFPYLGLEVAGTVVEAGEGAQTPVGSRVFGLVTQGGYAEYALMPDDWAMEIPEGVTSVQAAGIAEVFMTAFQTLYKIGNLQKGESVLIHAGASGVGTAAIQLARQLSDAQIFATAGSEEKLNFIEGLGVDHPINYKTQDFSEEVDKLTDGRGVNLVLDFIGAQNFHKNLASLAVDGRWVLIGTLGGDIVEEVNLRQIMQKRLQINGTLLSPRSHEYKADLVSSLIEATSKLFAEGKLKPIIDRTFPLEDVALAHQYMEEDQNIGKIILTVKE